MAWHPLRSSRLSVENTADSPEPNKLTAKRLCPTVRTIEPIPFRRKGPLLTRLPSQSTSIQVRSLANMTPTPFSMPIIHVRPAGSCGQSGLARSSVATILSVRAS